MSSTILAKSEFAIVVKNLTKRFSNSSSKVLRNSLLGIGSKAPKDFIALENISRKNGGVIRNPIRNAGIRVLLNEPT